MRAIGKMADEMPTSWSGPGFWRDLVQQCAIMICDPGMEEHPVEVAMIFTIAAAAHRQSKRESDAVVAVSGKYPHAPAPGCTDTSAAAASSIGKACGRIQRTVLLAITEVGARGLTAEELAGRLGMARTTVQPRTTELKLQGLIRKSEQRRPNRNGRTAIVWVATGGAA